MNDADVIVLLGEIARLRQEVRALNGIKNRLVQTLGELAKENKILKQKLKEN